VHTRKVPLAPDVDLDVIARGTPGFAGADLENLVNEAALLAARQDKDAVAMGDIELAKDKVLMGVERRNMVMSEKEKRMTAWHEAGHTLVGILVPGNDPVHKVSIIPRGNALGVTKFLPTADRYSMNKEQMLANIAMCLGGRVAEQIVTGEVTTGAINDIKQATRIARKMICEAGMSEKLGPVAYGQDDEQPFLGRDFGTNARDFSEQTAIEIDDEVRRIIREQGEVAHKVLLENRAALDRLAEALLERETLDSEEITACIEGQPLPHRARVSIPSWVDRRDRRGDPGRGTPAKGASIFPPRQPEPSGA
jgi:cell division protease FtsH